MWNALFFLFQIPSLSIFIPGLKQHQYEEGVEPTEDTYIPVSAADLGFTNERSRISFHDRTLNVKYMDRFDTLYSDRTWFDLFYKSMLLTDASDYVLDLSDDFIYKESVV